MVACGCAEWLLLQVDADHKIVLHFFIKQLTLGQFYALEKACLQTEEYGREVSDFSGGSDNDQKTLVFFKSHKNYFIFTNWIFPNHN